MRLTELAKGGKFSKILAAVDGSQESLAAVDKAIHIAKSDGAELIAFTVLQLPVVSHYTPAVLGSLLEKGTTEGEGLLGDVKKKAEQNDVKVKTRMVSSFGSPASEIVSFAEKESVDLIVMGTKGRGKLKKILLGSTASGVVLNASCTVMVVR